MMNDPVEAVIAAYLDHLEHGAPEPSLDHLGDDDRLRAIDLMDLMRDGRGIDVYRSRPSLDALLSGKNEAAALMEPLLSRAVSAALRAVRTMRTAHRSRVTAPAS